MNESQLIYLFVQILVCLIVVVVIILLYLYFFLVETKGVPFRHHVFHFVRARDGFNITNVKANVEFLLGQIGRRVPNRPFLVSRLSFFVVNERAVDIIRHRDSVLHC